MKCNNNKVSSLGGGSGFTGTGHESRTSEILVILVAHIECSRLFRCSECAVLPMMLYTKENRRSHLIRIGHICDCGLYSVAFFTHRQRQNERQMSYMYFRARRIVKRALGFESTTHCEQIDPISEECWSTTCDVGPTLMWHWINIRRFLFASPLFHAIMFYVHITLLTADVLGIFVLVNPPPPPSAG